MDKSESSQVERLRLCVNPEVLRSANPVHQTLDKAIQLIDEGILNYQQPE